MTTSAPDATPAGAGTLWTFTLTTFLSALLLFSVQPMFAKMVLPVLGGAPSVWAVALAFFQGALLVGYCYAHALVRSLPIARSGMVHLAVCALALLFLPIGLPEGWAEPPTGDVYLWQLSLFTVAIGLPFVAVAANAPLLQAWFARTGHSQSHDPYFLYAASNFGSLIALLGYPLVLEPVFGLKALSLLWLGGFAVLVPALGLCFREVWSRNGKTPAGMPGPGPSAAAGPAPGWRDRAAWVGLAMVPAALLTAFTTHIATDIASAPLLWVVPLSLYLLTFVVVFRERALIPAVILLPLHLVAVILALLQLSQIWHETWFLTSTLGVAAFVTSGLVAHRTLYEARPDARHLTEFYLWMSAGGVIGGLFAALVAPRLFSEVLEYPLLLALTVACRPDAVAALRAGGRERLVLAGLLALGALALAAGPWVAAKLDLTFRGWGLAAFLTLVFGTVMVVFWRAPGRQLVLALLMFLAVAVLPSGVHRGAAQRSYFGVYRVITSDDGQYNVLQHGTTLHGAQRIRGDDGKPIDDVTPVTYYYPGSPMAQSVRFVRNMIDDGEYKGRYAVIGLGAGALACHSEPGERWRFFEIDPVVVGIAKSRDFTYLSTCQPNADVVLGDARLTIAREPAESLDLLVVDAFSSDAVPMHLLTAEALSLYAGKLKPSGVAVLHISNRHLDLEGVLQATIPLVKDIKAVAIEDRRQAYTYDMTGSVIVVFSKDPQIAFRFLGIRGGRTLNYAGLRPWTDDASDVLGPFLSRLGKK